jgi:MoxR-like ATPase
VEIKNKITNEELEKFKREIEKVKISDDSFQIVEMIIAKIEEYNSKNDEKIYISDRRWQKAAKLMKASAYFNERVETNISDSVLLMHCLWSNEEDKKVLDKIIKDVIKTSSLSVSVPVCKVKLMLNRLEEEIKKELYYTDNVFDTVTLKNGKEYFVDKYIERDNWSHEIEFEQKFYILKEYYKTDKQFRPVDENGNEIEWIRCNFKGTGSCEIEVNDVCRNNRNNRIKNCEDDHYDWKHYETFKPKVLYKKGDRKKDINSRLIKAFESEIEEIRKNLMINLNEIQNKKEKFLKEIDNPFVADEKIKWCIDGIENQIGEINLLEKECDRIKGVL